jgi:hypothetical protein
MKRAFLFLAVSLSTACASTAALAHADIGVYLGVPGPLYVAPPQVVYESPPVVYAPARPYGYGYRYEGDDYDRRWHDHGRHRGWEHHHRDDD